MSRLHLLNEIATIVKMSSVDIDEVKLQTYLDDLLSNYYIEEKTNEMHQEDSEDYLKLYLNSIRLENYSNETITSYKYVLRAFIDFVEKPIIQVTTADIRKFLGTFSELKASTVNTKLIILRSFFKWLVVEDFLLRNPTLKIKMPKQPKRLREGLSIEELEIVRESCENARERALIEFFYSTGCRLSEIRNLNLEDINWQDMSTRVIGKGNKERKVYLSYKALFFLKKYLKTRDDDCPALFATVRRPFRRLTNRGIQYQVDKIEQRADINKKLTPHVLRHTFAMLGMESGMEIADLQHLLGHENPATTTQVYAPVSEGRKREAFRKFHVI
ncbi:tyrosine-type recombinase/integrase [Ureibacillus chungkukjangi]|uniref:tyrosine-type recombinase/integrase n=1 Tax=Ureibacillus chungkukjangi TaxID=1202712 RepID=UPI0038514913